jgi:hypothetical protein
MAAWDDVKAFLKKNYQVEKEEGNLIYIIRQFDDGRSQLVLVTSVADTNTNITWLQTYSPVGLIAAGSLNQALEDLDKSFVGGLVKLGDKHFVKHSTPIENLSVDEIDLPLRYVAIAADILEEKYVGGDQL